MKCCLPILNNQSSGTVLSVLSFLYSHALWACPLVMVNTLVIKDLALPEHSKSFLQFASFKRICDMSKSHIFWSSSRIKPKTHHVSLSAHEMLKGPFWTVSRVEQMCFFFIFSWLSHSSSLSSTHGKCTGYLSLPDQLKSFMQFAWFTSYKHLFLCKSF